MNGTGDCSVSQSSLVGELNRANRPVSQSNLVGESNAVSQSNLVGESNGAEPIMQPGLQRNVISVSKETGTMCASASKLNGGIPSLQCGLQRNVARTEHEHTGDNLKVDNALRNVERQDCYPKLDPGYPQALQKIMIVLSCCP